MSRLRDVRDLVSGPAVRRALAPWVPPRVKELMPGIRYAGPYPDWDAARAAATGYDAEVIAERCLEAALAVRTGQADFERDTVLFDHGDLPLPAVVPALLLARSLTSGPLRVLDFGGSLASTYVRCREWWDVVGPLSWVVVEQPGLAELGNRHLAHDDLAFVTSIEEARAAGPVSVVLAGSVLPYLTDPHAVLTALAAVGAPVLCLDRTQCAVDDVERCFVQHVPPAIYPASYPMRFLSWPSVCAALEPTYRPVSDFAAEDPPVRSGRHVARYRAGVWLRRSDSPSGVSGAS